MKHKYHYAILERDPNLESIYEIKSDFNPNHGQDAVEFAAEDAAQDFFDNHDGWEAKWPLTFVMFSNDEEGFPSAELGRFSVDLESEPVFRVSFIK